MSACTCVDGYNESASGDCTDINECDTGSPCDVAAACNNTLGSFTCVCNAGYHGNGSACQACDAGYTCSGGDSAPPHVPCRHVCARCSIELHGNVPRTAQVQTPPSSASVCQGTSGMMAVMQTSASSCMKTALARMKTSARLTLMTVTKQPRVKTRWALLRAPARRDSLEMEPSVSQVAATVCAVAVSNATTGMLTMATGARLARSPQGGIVQAPRVEMYAQIWTSVCRTCTTAMRTLSV